MAAQSVGGNAVTLVNGSYADGKAIVTNGNTIAFSSPKQYANIDFPLTDSIIVESSVEMMPSANLGTARFYARVDGYIKQIGANSHNANTWESISTRGTLTAIVIAPRVATYNGEIVFSLKVDGKVVF